jgi:hypothetical protein
VVHVGSFTVWAAREAGERSLVAKWMIIDIQFMLSYLSVDV